ncbi:unnamed protein product [Moneuplotes crassus]|uniref:Uncharacterized protein n=1 Tax=Euplotes crassus TaxID=5936 RepID=A0AAD2CWJ4_EUPCR|nr:unnamed protein product [Moneuplotes crassus]
MSEADAVKTPVRNAQDLVERIGNDTHYEIPDNSSIERTNLNGNTCERRSVQEWNESPIQDTKQTPLRKKAAKKRKNKMSNYGILPRMTPSKILESATKPVLSHTKSTRSPLNGKKTSNIDRASLKDEKRDLEKVFSDDPKLDDYEQLAFSAGSDHENRTEQNYYQPKDSVMSNYDMIKQVDQGKEDIRQKKQRLKDLEEEILHISEKMTSYQNETDLIIDELRERIAQREEVNLKIKEEPMFYTMNGNQEFMQQDVYSTSDELISLLKGGMEGKNKKFFESCKTDLRQWKELVGEEIKAFNQFLQKKHKVLTKDMADEISTFTPVLSGKFDSF